MIGWLRRAFGWNRLERDLDKELLFHVDTRTDALVEEGHSRSEARRLALAEFGGLEPIREVSRDARGTRWLRDLWQDLHYAGRVLRAHKAFTAAAVLSLGVGLGANAAVFRVMDSLMFRTLDVPRPAELFFLESSQTKESKVSHPAYLRLAEAAGSRADLAVATHVTTMQITVDGVAQLTSAQLVSGNFFSVLGVDAAMGRALAPADDQLGGSEATVVLSDRMWTRLFARRDSVLGSSVTVNGVPLRVVGIMPASFDGLMVGTPAGMWMPLHAQPLLRHQSNKSNDNGDELAPWVPQDAISWLILLGRTRGEVDRAGLEQILNGRYQQILSDRHQSIQDAARRQRAMSDSLILRDGSQGLSGTRDRLGPALRLLLGMSALVLVVACVNLANLLLVRGVARHREFALRLAIGANRGRLVRQLLAESLALAALGGLLGLAFATWGGRTLLYVVSTTSTPVPLNLPLDWRILGFGAAVTLLTGLAFGLVPALRLSRPQVGDALKVGQRVIGTGRPSRGFPIAKSLVAVQVALSFVLVVAAALFTQSFTRLLAVDAGFEREAVVTARFDSRLARFEPEELPELYRRLVEGVSRLQGVESATLGMVGPVTGSMSASSLVIDGFTPGPDGDPVANEDIIGDDYIRTLGMRLKTGRTFDARDKAGAERVAIVNETFVKQLVPSGQPIGVHFNYGGDAPKYTIVGVVADARTRGQREAVPPTIYYALNQHPDQYLRNLYARVTLAPDVMVPQIRKVMEQVAPRLAIREVVTLEELTQRTVATERIVSRLAIVLGILGIVVAVLGLYGAIAYSVARRTNEIGVRLALGAEPASVRWLVVRETLTVVVAGLVAGVAIAIPAGSLANSMLYGLSSRDPRTLILAGLAVIAVGALVGAIPAWRASRVNPLTALREG